MENKQLLKMDGSDSDEDVKEFELPPARSRRPKMRKASAENRISQGGSFCSLRGCLSLVLLIILLGAFLLLGWYIVVMQQDINLLKQHLRRVEADDDSNLQASTKLQQDLNGKLAALANDEREINQLREKLKVANGKITQLNETIRSLQAHMTKAGSVASLSSDVDQLKKGMADTGVELQKLTDEQGSMKTRSDKLVKIVKTINQKMFNVTAKLIEKSSLRAEMPILPPVEKSPEMASLPRRMDNLAQLVEDQRASLSQKYKNHSTYLRMEMYKLYSYIDVINTTCHTYHTEEKESMQKLNNLTSVLQTNMSAILGQIQPLVVSLQHPQRNETDEKISGNIENSLGMLRELLNGQQSLLTNTTDRLAHLERLAAAAAAEEVEEGSSTTITPVSFSTHQASSQEPTRTVTRSPTVTEPRRGNETVPATPVVNTTDETLPVEERFDTLSPTSGGPSATPQRPSTPTAVPRNNATRTAVVITRPGESTSMNETAPAVSSGASTETTKLAATITGTPTHSSFTMSNHRTRNHPTGSRLDSLDEGDFSRQGSERFTDDIDDR